ncbi:hypothetical protein VTL71DRAFT_15023 [Oculimacula yallundae]|uniref:Uncharacterized protein n=1 Tax=Oculimacula yallundae TaxID=86028 RepID=A0ABR4CFE7_9HELO
MEAISRDKDKLKPTFLGDYLPSRGPASQSSDRLSDQALMALPLIGMFVGVDELIPTKAVYAVYDPNNCGITYVRGDGTFATARQICFTRQYKDSSIPHHRSQRTYLPELMARSAMQYHRTNTGGVVSADNMFPTMSSVKASLTYLGGLKMDSCPALTTTLDLTPKGPGRVPPHMSLEGHPKWDFNTGGFQAFALPGYNIVGAKYEEFAQKYTTVHVTLPDFQQGIFCLAGLLKVDLVEFLQEGQNDRRYFVKNLTPPKPAEFVTPRRTCSGWTVDCFLARFAKYHAIYCTDNTFAQIPNPINWLEAEMDSEALLERKQQPWEISVSGKDDSVISWEELKTFDLQTRGDSKTYPKSIIPKTPRTLLVKDIVSKSGKLRESKYAKKQREAEEKASEDARRGNGSTLIDLTEGDGFVSGHMGRDPDSDRFGRGIRSDIGRLRPNRVISESEYRARTYVAGQKRRLSGDRGSSQSSTIILDDDEDDNGSDLPVRNKKPKHHNVQDEDQDPANDSGSERRRRKQSPQVQPPSPISADKLAELLGDYTKSSA